MEEAGKTNTHGHEQGHEHNEAREKLVAQLAARILELNPEQLAKALCALDDNFDGHSEVSHEPRGNDNNQPHNHGNAQNEHGHHHTADTRSMNTLYGETFFGCLNGVTLGQVAQAVSGQKPTWDDLDLSAWSAAVGGVTATALSFSAAGTHYFLNRRYQLMSAAAKRYADSGRQIPKVEWPKWLTALYLYYKYGDFASHTLNYASAAIQIADQFIEHFAGDTSDIVWKQVVKGLGYVGIMILTAIIATPGEVRPCWEELKNGFDFWAYDLYLNAKNPEPKDAFDIDSLLNVLESVLKDAKKTKVLREFEIAMRELRSVDPDTLSAIDKERLYQPVYNAFARDELDIMLLQSTPLKRLESIRQFFMKAKNYDSKDFLEKLDGLIATMKSNENDPVAPQREKISSTQLIRRRLHAARAKIDAAERALDELQKNEAESDQHSVPLVKDDPTVVVVEDGSRSPPTIRYYGR
jgi:hypothetical protein